MKFLSLLLLTASIGCARLEPPTDLRIQAVNDSTVTIEWRDWSDGEEGCLIFESVGKGPFEVVSRVAPDVTSATLEHRKPGATYRYQLKAFKGDDRSAVSSTVEVTMPRSIPRAPGNLIATPYSISQINLEWRDNNSNETGFIVERKAPDSQWKEVSRVGANTTTFSDIGLARGTTYYYRVCVFCPSGNSEYSNETVIATNKSKVLRVISPNGGEKFSGPDMTITFEADPTIGGLKIYFYTAENFWFKANSWASNQGSYIFRDFASLLDSKTYKIRIATSTPGFYDDSDGYFEIVKP